MDKSKQWLVHALAICHDCKFLEDDYTKALRRGRYHAKKTGHFVSIEGTYAEHINERRD